MTSQSDMLLYVKLPFTGCHVIRTVDCSELPPKHAATFEIPDIAYGGVRDMCCSGDNLFVTAKYEMEVFSYSMKSKMVLWHFKFGEFSPVLVSKSNEPCFTTEIVGLAQKPDEASELPKGPASPLKSGENYFQSLSNVATDGKHGHIFVCDGKNRCLHAFSTNAKYLGVVLKSLDAAQCLRWHEESFSLFLIHKKIGKWHVSRIDVE